VPDYRGVAAGGEADPGSGLIMSPSNVDIVLANSEAFSRQDVESMLGLWTPDAEMIDRRSVGWGEYRGREELRLYYQGLFDNVDSIHEGLAVVSSEGDVVIVTGHTTVRLAGDTGDSIFDYAMRITLTGGLIESLEIFEDADAAAGA
jgi:ketosteroid isomerase-like protein